MRCALSILLGALHLLWSGRFRRYVPDVGVGVGVGGEVGLGDGEARCGSLRSASTASRSRAAGSAL